MGNSRHITLPAGFLASGVKCGIKASGKPDVAVVVGEQAVAAALMLTSNQFVGAPVMWCRQALPKGHGWIRGIVVNAGNSNVATGKQGQRDAAAMAAQVARFVGARDDQILVASTGIIGHKLPMEKVRAGIAAAVGSLGTDKDSLVLRAIMTTDTREKFALARTRLAGGQVTLAGIIKGAGMIAPSVATMISIITTDAAIAPADLRRLFRWAVGRTINAVTIDSDQSTSDTALAMASGKVGRQVRPASADERKFAAALEDLCRELAMAMARDGEGATKLIVINVTGAATPAQAEAAAKTVANSPLFKCAVHGGDPNWGRIVAALGRSPAKLVPEKLTVKLGGVAIFARGGPKDLDLPAVQAHLKGQTVVVDANLGLGRGRYTAYTCDFSREYVAINADYHT